MQQSHGLFAIAKLLVTLCISTIAHQFITCLLPEHNVYNDNVVADTAEHSTPDNDDNRVVWLVYSVVYNMPVYWRWYLSRNLNQLWQVRALCQLQTNFTLKIHPQMHRQPVYAFSVRWLCEESAKQVSSLLSPYLGIRSSHSKLFVPFPILLHFLSLPSSLPPPYFRVLPCSSMTFRRKVSDYIA